MHSPQTTLERAVDRASEITWWNRQMTKLNQVQDIDNAVEFVEDDLIEQKGPYVELVKAPKTHDLPASEFLENLGYHEDIAQAVIAELFDGDATGELYQHQAETLQAIEQEEKDAILSVPTATGKTEAFFLPILNHCLSTDEEGLKSIVLYPMKTLSVDQLNRFLTYLDQINKDRHPEDQVTIGIWDGDTPHDVGSLDYEIEIGSNIRGLECPRTGKKLRVLSSNTIGTDDTDYSWVNVTRENIKNGVDILLTNPEALDYMFVNDSEETRNILGSRPSEHPVEHLVFDEAHVWSGISGAAVSLLTQRLKHFYADRDPQVTMVSATVDNPRELAASLTLGEEEDIAAVDFTGRNVPVNGTPDFSRFSPCTLPEVTEVLVRLSIRAQPEANLIDANPRVADAIATLREIGVVSQNEDKLFIADKHEEWIHRPIDREIHKILRRGEYESEENILDSEEFDETVEAVVDSGGATSSWFDFVVNNVPEVAAFGTWFETDTTGSVGFKKYDELEARLEAEGVEDPQAVLETVMLFGRLAGIVTEKYHSFLKPPSKVHWCRNCRIVSRSNACRKCGDPIPEVQFCRRCHYPYVELEESHDEAEEEENGNEEEDGDRLFAPIGTAQSVESCPGCDRYVNLTDIEVPTPSLLSYMLTEICRTAPSKKTLVFSDSHASAESVGGEIINTEYGLMAESLYVGELLEHDGVCDNYDLFRAVSEQLREAYYDPLFQNEIDEDSETYNILRQMREDITSNAFLSNCGHLFNSALVIPESLYQATQNEVDRRVIAHELYSLFAGNPQVGFSKETIKIQGLTREKICERISNQTVYSPSYIEQHIDEFLKLLLDERVVLEQSWDNIQQAIMESDVAVEREDEVLDYLESERGRLEAAEVFDGSFDSGVFTRSPQEDQCDLRLVPRVSYCTECYSANPVPLGENSSECRACGAKVETYDRFEIDDDGSYSGVGYADVDSEWKWPVDHWAHEVSRPLNSESGPEFITVGIHKGNIPPTLRGAIEEGFRKNNADINIVSATPTMELGVDIGTLDTVTQVGVPPTLTNYVQRSGRTGRTRGSSSLVMTVIRGDHPVDNHYYANLDGFFRDFEPVRVPDPYEFDELIAGQVMTAVVSYLVRNPHESNIFDKVYTLGESNTNLNVYVENVVRNLGILQDFLLEEREAAVRNHIEGIFGPRGVEVFERIFSEDDPLSLLRRSEFVFERLTEMSSSGETNKRLSDRHDRLDSWLALLGYLANYRDFGQQFPVKFSGRRENIEFESQGRLYDMFPGEENDIGSVFRLHGTQYLVDDVHGTNTPIDEGVTLCGNEDCDRPFQAYSDQAEVCTHCGVELIQTNVHGIGSVECRVARGGEEGYNTRGMMTSHVSPSDAGTNPQSWDSELFGLSATITKDEYDVTDFVYAFERGHAQSPDRDTLRSQALIEQDGSQGSDSNLSWEERLEDVSEEKYAPVGQGYHTRGLQLTFDRGDVQERLDRHYEEQDSQWPQTLASLEQAVKKAVAVIADADLQDFRVTTSLDSDDVEIFIVDGQKGGNGITWQIEQELNAEFPTAVTDVAACSRCADYCEECLLLERTPPSYLENDLLNKFTLRRVLRSSNQ